MEKYIWTYFGWVVVLTVIFISQDQKHDKALPAQHLWTFAKIVFWPATLAYWLATNIYRGFFPKK